MSIKLEKIAAEIEKARRKRDEWDARLKDWEQKYREQENTEIHDMVHAMNLSPEKLAEILALAANGGSPAPPVQSAYPYDSEEETEETEDET